VQEANKAMAAIADDASADENERRERMQAIWQPMAHSLIENVLMDPGAAPDRDAWDRYFVGVTCDTRRQVFLDKEKSASGLVYRKFKLGDVHAVKN
jgi:hypothetical protein